MTLQNIKLLSNYVLCILIFLAHPLYGEIVFDEKDAVYYKTHEKEYLAEDLIIVNNSFYVKNNNRWLIFENEALKNELNYPGITLTNLGKEFINVNAARHSFRCGRVVECCFLPG